MLRGNSIGPKNDISDRERRKMRDNPALQAYYERRGSHMSGRALVDRDMRLFDWEG